MKKWIIFLVLIAVGVGWWIYRCVDFSKPVDLESYTPSEECAQAYGCLDQAIVQSADTTGYDIEQTVRIMNSFEVAQSQSESFDDFLEYMARQDYRGVARDVLEAKRTLFPLLDEMNTLRRTQKELSSVWACLKMATRQELDKASGSYMLSLCSGNPATLSSCVNSAFDAYKEQADLKRKTERRLNRLRRQYIEYLEAYAPVYYKYMDEWNALCLDKDRAYINLYAGKLSDALDSSERVLQKHPVNREGLLLKAIALIRLGQTRSFKVVQPSDVALNQQWLRAGKVSQYDGGTLANPCYFTAQRLLDEYIALYPDKAAPALLLHGVLEEQLGHDTRAVAYYEQAAVEYPRQAEALTDLLDSYVNRTYLTQSVEGHYLINYYRSTMEGAGIFSPNFRKAALFARQGNLAASQEEIYKHFFRRGSQSVQDCLLSDMQYCEEYLAGSFLPMLLEQSYVDLKYEPSAKFMKMGKKKGRIDVSLTNRSDMRIENVRVFLCIHTTGMYKDDYDVVKIPESKSVVGPYATAVFENVDIAPRQFDDITRIRAIVMTDNRICWLDDAAVKKQNAIAGLRAQSDISDNQRLAMKRRQFMRDLSISSDGLCRIIRERSKVSTESGWFSGSMHVRIPRLLALLAPYCTINPIEDTDRALIPVDNKIVGDYIELTFDSVPDDTCDLYIYSELISFRLNLVKANNGAFSIGAVREI